MRKHKKIEVRILFFVCIFSIHTQTYGQIEPGYYELPQNRDKKGVLGIPLPNLSNETSKWFLQPEGAFLFGSAQTSSDLNGFLTPRRSDDLFWGVHTGYTHNADWKVSLGYVNSVFKTVSLLGSSRTSRIFSNSWGGRYDGISARYLHKLKTLDKVTKSANWMLGGGIIQYFPVGRGSLGTFSAQASIDNPLTAQIDVIDFTGQGTLQNQIPHLEIHTEINGLLADFLEVSAFARGQFSPQRFITSSVSATFNGQQRLESTQLLNRLFFQMGVSISYNYFRHNRYKETIAP